MAAELGLLGAINGKKGSTVTAAKLAQELHFEEQLIGNPAAVLTPIS